MKKIEPLENIWKTIDDIKCKFSKIEFIYKGPPNMFQRANIFDFEFQNF